MVEAQQQLQEIADGQVEVFHLGEDVVHLGKGRGLRINTRNRPALQQDTGLHQVTRGVARARHVQAQGGTRGGGGFITQVNQHLLATAGVELHQVHVFEGSQGIAGAGSSHANRARNLAVCRQVLAQLNITFEQFVLEPAQNFTMNSHVYAVFRLKR